MRVAYVVGQYPAVSHTFILREVHALRRLGVEVLPISIHRTSESQLLSEADRAEARLTASVLPVRWPALIRAHLTALLTRPHGYMAALRLGQRTLAQPGLRGRLWSLFHFAEAGMVWWHARRAKVDHLHVHHLNQASDATMMAVAIEGSRPSGERRWTWSFTIHGPDDLADVTLRRVEEKTLDADAVACISDFARSQVMSLVPQDHWSKLHIVRCGIDPEEFAAPADGSRGNGPLNVLYVGRMVPVKGQTILLDAVETLVARGVDVRVVMIGAGARLDAVRQSVADRGLADRVELPGAVGQDEIRDYYRAADVFALPSFAEGVPVVLMEAMAMELPVVTTRIAGIQELVEDRAAGFVVPPARADAVADALRQLADDPELRVALGRHGRAKVIEEFTVDRNAARLHHMLVETVR